MLLLKLKLQPKDDYYAVKFYKTRLRFQGALISEYKTQNDISRSKFQLVFNLRRNLKIFISKNILTIYMS